MKFLKYVLLGGAAVAPINTAAMIDLGKPKAALVWCGIAFAETVLVILLDVALQKKNSPLGSRNRGSRIYEL